jgi:hypothetical protein
MEQIHRSFFRLCFRLSNGAAQIMQGLFVLAEQIADGAEEILPFQTKSLYD